MRQKAIAIKIADLHNASQTLREIAALQDELSGIDAKADQAIAKIKEDAAKKGESLRKKVVELEQALALYSDYNKNELYSDKRSIELAYGRMGYHKSTKVKIKTKPIEKSTLYLLEKLFRGKGIRIKKEVNKEELKDWPDEKLAQVNAKKEKNDSFYYEIDREQINNELLARTG